MTLGIALLGAGRIGQVHATAMAATPGARLVAVADPVDAAARMVAEAHGCDVRSVDDIADSDDVDAVAICTPTNTHADLIERFARAGKAVFCEKPIDLDLRRARACLSVVAECSAVLMVGFNRRFDRDFAALHAAIRDGRIGTVEMVVVTSRDPSPPPLDFIPTSGGIFRDMTVHDFDICRWLLGEEIETVTAVGSVLTDPQIGLLGDYDSANVILRTATGKQAVITNSRRAVYGYDQRVEVLGSKGMVQAGNTLQANVTIATQASIATPPLQDFFMQRYAAAYANEIAAFVAAVAGGAPPPTTGDDALYALALADAALRSIDEGRSVRLAEILG